MLKRNQSSSLKRSIAIFLITLCLGSLSKPLQAKPKPNSSPPPPVELSTYERAKQELPEDFYVGLAE